MYIRNEIGKKSSNKKIRFSFHVWCRAGLMCVYVFVWCTMSRQQIVMQRERKQRKLYAEEYALGDDEHEGVRGFSVAEKLASDRFAQTGMVREMIGADLSVG